ncbi:MAG: hypothetical protein RKE49_03120 [Oceanicaulis sp.]
MGVLAALASLALTAEPGGADALTGEGEGERGAPVEAVMEARAPGLSVRYRFAEPAAQLRLAAPLRDAVDRVRLDGAAGRLQDGVAACGETCRFTDAELHRFAPTPRAYPDFIDAGACGLWADVSAYAPMDPQTGAPIADQLAIGDRTIALTGEIPQYVAVRAPERAPVCADIAVMAEDRLGASAARMAADYGAIFGHLPGAPRLILSRASVDRPGLKPVHGAAAGDGLVFLFARPGAEAERVLAVLSHEIAHLWIGRRARLHPQFEQAWIYEGAAEYLSLKQLLRIDAADEAYVAAEIARHAGACLAALEEGRLTLNRSTQKGAFPYNCGTLAAVYADQAMQRAGSSFEAAMADMVADPAFRQASASALEFMDILGAHMGPEAERAFREVILADIPNKQARFLALLTAAGLGAEAQDGPGPSAGHLAAVAARHVVAQLCPAGGGEFWIDEGVVIELGAACDGPEGTSVLAAVAGADLMDDGRAAIHALEAACASGERVPLSLGPESYALTCNAPLPDYFKGFALNAERALQILSAEP